MKKIIILFGIILAFAFSWELQIFAADCEYIEGNSVSQNLGNCLSASDLVNPGDWKIEWSVKAKIVYWTNQLAKLLWLLAVGAIVYGAGLMTLSVWDDEKIKKWKDVVKWSMLGFLWLLLAGALVRLVIEIMFSIWG